MNAEIIAVGTELLLGQITNTNAKFLSEKLASIGINVYYHTVVGDNNHRLQEAIQIAEKRADILIFTGGLGPTKDDLTKETIASVIGEELVYDEIALTSISEYYKRTGREFTENNKKQALVLNGSAVFANDHGMAPGMGLNKNEKVYILLPGPPKEMQPMYTNYVDPFLRNFTTGESIYSRVLRFFGIGESQLEVKVQDLIDRQTNPTIAPLASDGEVTLRLTAKHHDVKHAEMLIQHVESLILERVGEFFYGYNQDFLHYKAIDLLKKKGFTLACAESLTGGLFGNQVTENAGVSSIFKGGVICYQNDVKQHILHVPEETLQTAGAVSEECARFLAENVKTLLKADIGISFTGVAGPEASENKEPGTVFVGLAIKDEPTAVFPLTLSGSRQQIRERSVKYGFYHLYKKLEEM
ncbi:competence/damage-inducible protein A [Bacillus pseudomycoides]|uniref:Putative competence-damage inducible protein n=1 Tax=Bacillus pseudomycoides TaxID=64104 RepID=A0AA91ZUY9_9BACI|nr:MULTISPECIES: competence/damage-inducible protein A [Bacillus]PEB55142.1 competence/damage-inducible protein A [Bacillus sp. AFS098217]PED84144.1 competence/damage-inducible protein A [Bacillus pseudomycoides]PEU15670.1 competence/damage-inducible protein A [Bacillus sp. AFS019443]PEU21174.1 competence/damage-inducible protein A [Bacillus sp. AFS014408]PFW65029.1 competence/damage-inducible protein A [Bacillus sp. AFS075034]